MKKEKAGYLINDEKITDKLQNTFLSSLTFSPISSKQIELYDTIFLESKKVLSEEMLLFLEYFNIPIFEVFNDLSDDINKYDDIKFIEKDDTTYMITNMEGFYFKVKEELKNKKNNFNNIDIIKVLQTINNKVETKEDCELGHSLRVARYSKMVAEKLCVNESDIQNIYFAGLFHDIGKIGIPEKILTKKDKLTEDEYNIIKKHTLIGTFLFPSEDYKIISNIIKDHHERYDGSGYPNGLKGNSISLGGRVVAIADSYDAMTSHRLYNKEKTKEEAIDELKSCTTPKEFGGKGIYYDPYICNVFIEQIKKF